MSLENNQPVKSDDNQAQSAKVDNSRRSFAKKSAAIAPVIMTLANRSAWGQMQLCDGNQSVTGFSSYVLAEATGHPSHHATPVSNNAWKTPDEWHNTPKSDFPASYNFGQSKSTLSKWNTGTNTEKLEAYRLASELNHVANGPFPLMFRDGSVTELEKYEFFYSRCVVG